jgi:hypothetical protein
MFNSTARAVFDERLKKIHAMPAGDLVGSESELNYLQGFVSYALWNGDIDHQESSQMNSNLAAARSARVSRLCSATERMHA